MRVLENLEPKKVFEYFEEICSIPHGSRDTKRISDYLVQFAVDHGFTYYQDEQCHHYRGSNRGLRER